MIGDITNIVTEDAETDRELIEGLGVISRVTALCSELTVEADPELPWFFDMCSPTRLVGGPNPDGRYLLAMIRGDRGYRVTGTRGTTAYLGFQVLAGTGMTPRRMAAYVSDTDLKLDGGGFALVFSAAEPSAADLDGAQWVQIPDDATSIVVREYIADAETEQSAVLHIDPLSEPQAPHAPSDDEAAEQFTAMAWTIMKLTTLHRTIKPELLTQPNKLMTAEAADLGAADTTPDNLYMIGTFRLDLDESSGARVRAAGYPVLEHHAGEHLARMPRTASQAQFRHQQGRGARFRRRGSYRHRRQGLRPRPLVGHGRQAPRLRGVPVAGQPRSAEGVGRGAKR